MRAAAALPACLRLLLGSLIVGSLLVGCGGVQAPGGHGALVQTAGQPDLLVLEGSPYQMGWWHGHLLKDRILALRARWEGALFQAAVGGASTGADGKGAAGAVREHCDLCEDQTRHNLSERMLQEVDGIAAATGLTPREVLWLDVIRDALRMKGVPARLVGSAGVARTPQGFEARAWWAGPDAEVLGDGWVVIQRRPTGGVESLAVAWPGSLGALAVLEADGGGYLLADAEVRDHRKRGFGAGRPLHVAAREALPDARSAGYFMAMAKATMGHVLLGFSYDAAHDEHPARAMGGLVYYVDPEPPRVLDGRPFLGLGPYESAHDPRARALRATLAEEGAEPEERWLRLRAHADATGGAAGAGPRVIIRYESGRGSLAFAVGERARTVELEAAEPGSSAPR